MPFIKLKTSGGETKFHYDISTPSDPSAASIDPSVPTILFLHPVYLAAEVFHPQFKDPRLRSFNLVAFDLRGHGQTGGAAGEFYGQDEAADDVYNFINALRLPPVYVFGLSLGTILALRLAVRHPEKCLGLFLVSQLGPAEPPEVAEGREEIYQYWQEGVDNQDGDAMEDAVRGAMQLAFNNTLSHFGQSVLKSALERAPANWLPSARDTKLLLCDFVTQREPYTPESLVPMRPVPVFMVSGECDIAYPPEFTEGFERTLADADIDVCMRVVGGAPHFASMTHPEEVNPMLYSFVLKHHRGAVPPIPRAVTSPFAKVLIDFGYHSGEESDDDDDDSLLETSPVEPVR